MINRIIYTFLYYYFDMENYSIEIREVPWEGAEAELRSIRSQVFVQEQGVPEALEWDGLDSESVHLLAVTEKCGAVGTVRLSADSHIGRMAVLKNWRNKKVGAALLERIVWIARERGMQQVVLNAQTTAIGFYAKFGFQIAGEEFMDAGIPHFHMILSLRARK